MLKHDLYGQRFRSHRRKPIIIVTSELVLLHYDPYVWSRTEMKMEKFLFGSCKLACFSNYMQSIYSLMFLSYCTSSPVFCFVYCLAWQRMYLLTKPPSLEYQQYTCLSQQTGIESEVPVSAMPKGTGYNYNCPNGICPGLSGLQAHIKTKTRATTSTYDHRLKRIGHPVRSAIHKLQIGWLVVGWVTTSESQLLYVLSFLPFWQQIMGRGTWKEITDLTIVVVSCGYLVEGGRRLRLFCSFWKVLRFLFCYIEEVVDWFWRMGICFYCVADAPPTLPFPFPSQLQILNPKQSRAYLCATDPFDRQDSFKQLLAKLP